MELQRIASNQVNFQANNTPSAKPKEKVTQEQATKYAIGALALIMFISSFYEVSEIITGLIGLVFIIGAFICSVIHNKKEKTND